MSPHFCRCVAQAAHFLFTEVFYMKKEAVCAVVSIPVEKLPYKFKQLIAEDRTDELYNEIKEANRIKDVLKG